MIEIGNVVDIALGGSGGVYRDGRGVTDAGVGATAATAVTAMGIAEALQERALGSTV